MQFDNFLGKYLRTTMNLSLVCLFLLVATAVFIEVDSKATTTTGNHCVCINDIVMYRFKYSHIVLACVVSIAIFIIYNIVITNCI